MDEENVVIQEDLVEDISEVSEDTFQDIEYDYTNTLSEISVGINAINDGVQNIGHDVRVILCIVLLSFCWSCMRGWRRNVTKEWR